MPRHELGMPRHASLGFLTESSKSAHAAAQGLVMPRHALELCPNLLLLLLYALFVRSLIILLEHHLQHENTHQNVQNR